MFVSIQCSNGGLSADLPVKYTRKTQQCYTLQNVVYVSRELYYKFDAQN